MKDQLLSDGCLDALREDLPTSADERRIRARLVGAGLGVTLTAVAPHAASAALKVGIWSGLATRLATLPLLTQMVLVSAGTATVVTPVVVAYRSAGTPSVAKSGGNAPATVSSPSPIAIEGDSPAATQIAVTPLDVVPSASRIRGGINAEPAASTSARRLAAESTLAEEAQLLDAALAAIRAGELIHARRLIEQHGSRYPNGRLVAERERAHRKLVDALAASTNAR